MGQPWASGRPLTCLLAQAGIHPSRLSPGVGEAGLAAVKPGEGASWQGGGLVRISWIPTCAGMTTKGLPFRMRKRFS